MENIVLDARGYAKIVDLGFAVSLPGGEFARVNVGYFTGLRLLLCY